MNSIPRVLDASDPRILAQQNRRPATTVKPASEKQIDLIKTLCAEKGVDMFELGGKLLEDNDFDTKHLTGGRTGTASQMITHLFSMGRKATDGTTRVDPEPGLYRVDDEIVRIKVSKSGNWYAQRANKREGRSTFEWEYLGKRINMATAETIADDEAGKFLGYCVRCCAELTDPDSIARGLGPVCAKKGL